MNFECVLRVVTEVEVEHWATERNEEREGW